MGKAREKTYHMTEDQIKAIIKEAVGKAIEEYKKEERMFDKRKANHIKFNTRILLENYHRLNKYAEDAIYSANQILEDESITEQDIKVMMKCGFKTDDVILHSVAEGAMTVKGLMIQVNKMLKIYQQDCEGSSSEVKRRQYRVIRDMYLTEKRLNTRQIAENEQEELRTIQNDAKQARDDISVLLFGINGLVEQIIQ